MGTDTSRRGAPCTTKNLFVLLLLKGQSSDLLEQALPLNQPLALLHACHQAEITESAAFKMTQTGLLAAGSPS